jgi:hypothetical protein
LTTSISEAADFECETRGSVRACDLFVGAFRVDAVGLEIFTSEALDFWFIRWNIEHNPTGFTLGLWMVEDARLMFAAKLGFAMGTAMGILAPLCLFSRPFRYF